MAPTTARFRERLRLSRQCPYPAWRMKWLYARMATTLSLPAGEFAVGVLASYRHRWYFIPEHATSRRYPLGPHDVWNASPWDNVLSDGMS